MMGFSWERIFKVLGMLFILMTAAVALALWLVPTDARGPAGPPGVQGAQGIEGPAGDTGDTGAKGAKGSKGDAGEDGAKGKTGAGFWGASK